MIDGLRHEHDWPHERVAVGSGIWSHADVLAIRADGITHVIDCRECGASDAWYRDTGVEWVHFPTNDDGARKSHHWFDRGIKYALDALRDPQAKVLVHCAAGINRGPSMAYAILRALGHSAAQAECWIRQARPSVQLAYRRDADTVDYGEPP